MLTSGDYFEGKGMNWSNTYTQFQLLRQVPIFASCNWLELYFIAERMETVSFRKNETVYRKGDPADAFYCVVSGRLLAYNCDAHGRKNDVEYIYRGMYFGIVSLLTGEAHSLNFDVLNDAVLIRIEKNKFNEILKRIPRLGLEISYSLSRRLRKQQRLEKNIFESTIIAVYSPFHRIGSSFYAFNLAQQLYRESKRKVVFVHLFKASEQDPLGGEKKKSALIWKRPAVDFSVLTQNTIPVDEMISRTGDVDLLHVCFESGAKDLSSHISHFVSTLAHDYHYIVLDLPNHADSLVFKTLTQSDECHLLLGPSSQELELAKPVVRQLKDAFSGPGEKNRFKIFIRERPEERSLTFHDLEKILAHTVYAKLSDVAACDLLARYSCEYLDIVLPSVDTVFAQQVRRLAREITKVQIGLALGGGAAFGLSLIGVLRVLEKEKIPVDVVAGSSIGALIGGMWALGFRADEIADFAREFRSKLRCLTLLDIVFPRSGLIGGRGIKRWLRGKIGSKDFQETRIPLKVVAFDILRHEERVIEQGDIVDAIRQSISIPGFMCPVRRQGRVMIDGGMANPLPVNVCLSLGVSKVIAVNIMKSPDDIARDMEALKKEQEDENRVRLISAPGRFIKWKIVSFFQRLWSANIFDLIVKNFLSMCYVLAEQSGQRADVVIHPDLTGVDWYELYKVDELIDRGEKAAQARLQEIRELIYR